MRLRAVVSLLTAVFILIAFPSLHRPAVRAQGLMDPCGEEVGLAPFMFTGQVVQAVADGSERHISLIFRNTSTQGQRLPVLVANERWGMRTESLNIVWYDEERTARENNIASHTSITIEGGRQLRIVLIFPAVPAGQTWLVNEASETLSVPICRGDTPELTVPGGTQPSPSMTATSSDPVPIPNPENGETDEQTTPGGPQPRPTIAVSSLNPIPIPERASSGVGQSPPITSLLIDDPWMEGEYVWSVPRSSLEFCIEGFQALCVVSQSAIGTQIFIVPENEVDLLAIYANLTQGMMESREFAGIAYELASTFQTLESYAICVARVDEVIIVTLGVRAEASGARLRFVDPDLNAQLLMEGAIRRVLRLIGS